MKSDILGKKRDPDGPGPVLEGILTENSGYLLPGLRNSFLNYESTLFWKRYRHIWLFIVVSLLQVIIFLTDVRVVGFGGGDGVADFTKIGLDMGGFRSRRRSSEFIEIDEVFGNQYVADKKKIVDPSKINLTAGGSDDGDDFGFGDGSGFGGAFDLAFRPDVRVPRLVTRLKKVYPPGAKEMNVEAKLVADVLISTDGVVRGIKVKWISLSKELPKETTQKFKRDFALAARQILMGAQFTPAVIDGKILPVSMELPLNFVLE